MDNVYGEPVKIQIAPNEETQINAIRNLYFSDIHARGPRGIQLAGREQNHLDNIRFSNCTFEVTDYSAFDYKKYHGAQSEKQSHGGYPKIEYCDRVIFDNVEFMVKN